MHAIPIVSLSVLLAIAAPAAQQAVSKAETVTATAKVQAIDKDHRTMTLRMEDGTENSVYVPSDVQRFDALQVGDTVKVAYHESYVFQVRKPGAAPSPEGTAGMATRAPGDLPGGTMAQRSTATVEVVSVDADAPSITVKTSDGRTVTRKVKDKANLEGVKPGDKIDITFTQAAAISVERAEPK